jgi:hypothetical protein
MSACDPLRTEELSPEAGNDCRRQKVRWISLCPAGLIVATLSYVGLAIVAAYHWARDPSTGGAVEMVAYAAIAAVLAVKLIKILPRLRGLPRVRHEGLADEFLPGDAE